jgi:hypothetical protein
MNTGNRYVDILNGILEKMEAKEIRFIASPHPIHADVFALEFLDMGDSSRRKFLLYTRKFYWKDIDTMFNDRYTNIANIVKYMDRKFFNESDMRFLDMLAGCSCWGEFMLKLQLMGMSIV